MSKKKSNGNWQAIFVKLLPLLAIIIIINTLILATLSIVFKIPLCFPIIISLLPGICLYVSSRWSMRRGKFLKDKGEEQTGIQYFFFFPYYFTFSTGKCNAKIDTKLIAPGLEECDILLRKFEGHLDGLIFSENSYFTHAGIYYKNDANQHKVLHASYKNGVSEDTLENFCKCHELAVLRFSLENTKEDNDVGKYIDDETTLVPEAPLLREQEQVLFKTLLNKTKLRDAMLLEEGDQLFKDNRHLILQRAKSLIGREYDCSFNFDDFERFSCIEYVWYCFKCFFPFHRIRVKDFEFFNFIKVPVIVPDVFVKNDFFHYHWSSIEAIQNLPRGNSNEQKRQLKTLVKSQRSRFWFFIFWYFVWSIAFLGLTLGIKNILHT